MFKLYHIAALSLMLSGPLLRADETTETWAYSDVKALSKEGVLLYTKGGHDWKPAISTTEMTPDGQPSLSLEIEGTAEDVMPWSKQVNFIWPKEVSAGDRFRISFYIKGSANAEIQCVAAHGSPPYGRLGKKSGIDIQVRSEWQHVEFEFAVDDSFPSPQVMPRLLAGNYPTGQTLWIGPVSMKRIGSGFASLLGDEWQYRAEAKSGELPVDRVPKETVSLTPEDGVFNIAGFEGRMGDNASALFYQEFDASADGVMTVGMGADWYFECFCNGRSVYSTLGRGNVSSRIEATNHIINVPVRQGKNLIAVRVHSGSAGWRFAAGRVPEGTVDLKLGKLFKPVEGAEYRPVDDHKFLEVKQGTALDLSGLDGLPRPAGALGRLVVGSNGKPVFEKRPDIPVRFLSFNWTLNGGAMWRQNVHEWDATQIRRFADAVERRGYNLIRIHIPETFLVGWTAFHEARKRKLDEVSIPQTVAELEKVIDAGNLDRLDRFIAAFKERGIYVTLDLAGRHMITLAAASGHQESFKARLFTDPVYRNHWKLFAGYLMNRVNPYTQVAYKDEAAIAFVSFINEQDLRFALGLEFLTDAFRKELQKKYGSDEALAAAWNEKVTFETIPNISEGNLRGEGRRAEDTVEFLIGSVSEMTEWFLKTLRDTGYKGLVTHWDMIMRTLELPGRALLPTVAQHTYFAHPGKLPAHDVIPKSVRPNSFVGNYPKDVVIDQSSSVNSSYFRSAAVARFLDRPYFITEYSHCGPNRFRHERGLYFSSYAALQDWDALTAHANTVKLSLDPFLEFDNALDPISRANELLAALIYLRRDVQIAPSTVALEPKNAKMFPKHSLSAIGDDYAKLALVTRVGVLYPEVTPLEPVGTATPTLKLDVEEFGYLNVTQWYVRPDATGGGQDVKLFQMLRDRGILAKDNPTDPARRYFVSETGEIILDGKSETMRVITPRLEGAIIKGNGPVRLGRLSIDGATRPASIAIAAIEGKKTLVEANRLLLVVSTNAFNTGQIFDTSEQRITYEAGNHPALVEAIKARLTFDDNRSVLPEVYSLNFDGTRAEKITVLRESGMLRVDLDTSRLQNGACIFEIAYL